MAVYVKMTVDFMSKARVMDCWASTQRECSGSSPDVGYKTIVFQEFLNLADAKSLAFSVNKNMLSRQVLLKQVSGKYELE